MMFLPSHSFGLHSTYVYLPLCLWDSIQSEFFLASNRHIKRHCVSFGSRWNALMCRRFTSSKGAAFFAPCVRSCCATHSRACSPRSVPDFVISHFHDYACFVRADILLGRAFCAGENSVALFTCSMWNFQVLRWSSFYGSGFEAASICLALPFTHVIFHSCGVGYLVYGEHGPHHKMMENVPNNLAASCKSIPAEICLQWHFFRCGHGSAPHEYSTEGKKVITSLLWRNASMQSNGRKKNFLAPMERWQKVIIFRRVVRFTYGFLCTLGRYLLSYEYIRK